MENERIKGNKKRISNKIILSSLLILLIVSMIASLRFGRYGMSFSVIFDTIKRFMAQGFLTTDREVAVLFSIRLPRIFLAIIAGASLSASGAAYQGIFKNPMVSPDILGVSSGASIGACLAILLDFKSAEIQLTSFVFGLIAVGLVILISTAVGKETGESLLVMVLAGTVISSLCSGLTSLIKYVADTDVKLPEITFWLMGSFAKTGNWKNVGSLGICFLVGVIPLLLLRWRINVLSFGEEEAQTMGVDTKRTRLIIILSATLLTASTVAFCGTIGWVGLVIPHISRYLVGSDYLSLLPCSILSGSIFMLVVDTFARSISSGEIPIGVLTSIIGAPIFIYLLVKRKGSVLS